MKSASKYLVVAAVVCTVLLIGEIYAYAPIDRYDSKISVDGTNVDYEISSIRQVQYSVVLLDNTDYRPIDTLYIHEDWNYKICMSESEHRYYLEKLGIILKVKGFTNFKYVNTQEMYSLLDNPAAGKGLVISGGAIPIVSDNPDNDINRLLTWINGGGSLYWTYGVIGKQLSYSDRLVESDKYNTLINSGVEFSRNDQGIKEDQYGARKIFSLENFNVQNAPLKNTVTGNAKYFGYNDGNAYAVTSIEKGQGQICILSGNVIKMNTRQIRDLATLVDSGLSCFTNMTKLKVDAGSFSGKLHGTFDITGYDGNTIVYVNLGADYTVYSARHVVR